MIVISMYLLSFQPLWTLDPKHVTEEQHEVRNLGIYILRVDLKLIGILLLNIDKYESFLKEKYKGQ